MQLNLNPHRDTLRTFGIATLIGCGLLAGLAWWRWELPVLVWSSGIFGVMALLCGLFVPAAARWLYVGITVAVYPIGFVVSHILMAILYYGLLTPIGLIMRATGRDPLQRRFERSATTYWQRHPPPRPAERYFKQY